jgi:DNA-binding response OmpR family regulator
MRVLVAEDDDETLRVIRSALRSAQCELLVAKTRDEAKRLLKEEDTSRRNVRFH